MLHLLALNVEGARSGTPENLRMFYFFTFFSEDVLEGQEVKGGLKRDHAQDLCRIGEDLSETTMLDFIVTSA